MPKHFYTRSSYARGQLNSILTSYFISAALVPNWASTKIDRLHTAERCPTRIRFGID
jgi:hypothetical protein